MDRATTIARQFAAPETIARVEAYGSGNINDTFLVQLNGGQNDCFILQRINQRVFPYPERIMENLRVYAAHVSARMQSHPLQRRWDVPQIVPTRGGDAFTIDEDNEFWRALTFVAGARTYPSVQSPQHAYEAGYGLGLFHRLISDLDPALLHDTLPGFHLMSYYLSRYDEAVAKHGANPLSAEERYCMRFVAERYTWAPILEHARQADELQERTIHGDPKIDNIMIDEVTGEAVSIIDLDTVKPGLTQYDIGDCLRSSCNPLGEETTDFDNVRFELDLCEVILRGYLPEVEAFYTEKDYAYLFDGVRVLAFEMGLRFFTDHLNGNIYFKVRHPEHNLNRAVAQFRLTESLEAQEAQIRHLVASMKRTG